MNCKKSILSAAILASLGFATQLQAQESTAAAQTTNDATELETVTVIGIRGSIEKSLEAKRDNDSRVEVITSEEAERRLDAVLARLDGAVATAAGG